MSELDDFMRWGAAISNGTIKGKHDRFGHMLDHAPFPSGTLSWWITEFRRHRDGEA